IPRAQLEVSPSVRFVIPISKQSRLSTLRLGVTGSVGFGRSFLQEKLRLGYGFGFTKNFHQYSTPGIAPGDAGTGAELGDNPYNGVMGVGLSNLYTDASRVGMSGFNSSFSFSNSINGSYKIDDDWSVDGTYMWTDGFSYGHTCVITATGTSQDTCRSGRDV